MEIAIQNKNVEKEISLRLELFEIDIKKIADYTEALNGGIYMEPLIAANLDNPNVLKIAPKFFGGIAWLYHGNADYEKSNEYYEKAILYARKLNDEKAIFKYKGAIGFNEFKLGKREKAFGTMQDLFNQAEKLKDTVLIANSNYLFYIILVEENPEKALKYAKSSLNTSDLTDLSHRYINVGTCFLEVRQLDSALHYTKLGEKIALDNKFIQQESNAYNQLRDIYSRMGDYQSAYHYFQAFDALDRKINSYKSSMELVKIQREQMNLEEALNTEKLNNQKNIKWISFGVLTVLVIMVLYLFNQLNLINKQKRQIELEKARAEQSEKYKEQFLANMSHEIRTPMHAISGITNTLLRNKHAKSQNAYLEAMKTSSDNLLVLLDDILDLSKIESGELKIEKSKISPHQIIDNVIKAYKFRAKDKGIKLTSEVSANVPEKIIGDTVRLTQILINLVGNAIKFTESGSISVKLHLNENSSNLIFSVQDTGIGISKSKIDSIFETFKQGDKSKSQIYRGTGLGLSIAKKLVELQAGRIWVVSEPKKGSTFYFELPLIIPPKKNLEDEKHLEMDITGFSKKLKGLKVLLAEDDEFNIMVVQDDLNYYIENLQIFIANNGEEAINLFKTDSFDIVLMDMHMPIVDGIEATKQIRGYEKTKKSQTRVPIIAMTANIVKSEIEKCLKAGMNDYLPKPYKPEQLIIKLFNMVEANKQS